MISHKHKCLFIHIPKTAGQSIEHFFLNDLGLTWENRFPLMLTSNNIREIGPPRLSHLIASDYTKHHYLSTELFSSYFKFTFVRNPWTRVLSFYKYGGYNKFISFEDYIIQYLEGIFNKKYWFMMPQKNFIYDKNKLLVDFVGKFENLQDDFDKIAKILGFNDSKLPYINNSKEDKLRKIKWAIEENPSILIKSLFSKTEDKKMDYMNLYNNKTRKIVEKLYKEDIELFNYQF